MRADNESIEREIEQIALRSRASNHGNMRRRVSDAGALYQMDQARKRNEDAAKHGPVKQIVKDGRPCL